MDLRMLFGTLFPSRPLELIRRNSEVAEFQGFTNGGASRDRTDDLIVANSETYFGPAETEKAGMISTGNADGHLGAVRFRYFDIRRHRPRSLSTNKDS